MSRCRTGVFRFPRLRPPAWLLLFSGAAYAIAAAVSDTPLPMADPLSALAWLAPLSAVAALLLVTGSADLFRRAGTTIDPHANSRVLVTHGPYRFSRNPMYLAMLLALCAWVLWLGALQGLVLPPLFAGFLTHRFIRPEERRLQRLFGDEYRAYCRRTRRWL